MGLARNALETFITRGFVAVMSVLITVLVARTLGPDGRGIFATAMAVAAIGVQLGNVGLSSSNIYYASTNHALIRHLVGNSLLIGVAGSALFCFLVWIIFEFWPDLAPLQGRILWVALIWVPVGIGLLLMQNLLLGMQQVRVFNVVEMLKQGGTLVAIAISLLLGFGTPFGLFSVSLLILFVIFVATTGYVMRADGNRPMVSLALAKEHARYGIKAYFATFFAFLVLRIDLLMVQYISGEESTGFYSVAVAITDVLYLAPVALGTVLFPRLSAMQDEEQRWQIVLRAMRWMVLIMSITSFLLMLGSGWVLELLFGEAYLPAMPALLVLLPAVALLGVNTIFMNYFASLGMPMITVISPAVAATVNIPANYFLIPVIGIVGAAWASLISYALMLLMSLGYIRYLRKNRSSYEF